MTPREREIARLLCERGPNGRLTTSVEVARTLRISVATVNAHLRSLANKIPNPHGLPAQRLVRSQCALIIDTRR